MHLDRVRIRKTLRAAVVVITVAFLMDAAWTPSDAAPPSGRTERVDPVLFAQAKAHPAQMFDVIVQAAPATTKLAPHAKDDSAERAGNAVKRAGELPRRQLGFVGGATATIRGASIIALSNDPDVAFIYADARMQAKFDPQAGAALLTEPGQIEVGAPAAWSQYGVTGHGVGVAIVDSGIYAHPDLAGRVVAAIDLTSASPQVSPVPLGDPGGHGTHVAGLVAGDGTASGGAYTGIAPGANLIDVRVINGNGGSNVSTILAGLQWVLANRLTYNIRVVNLSLGAPEQTGYRLNPLDTAVEVMTFAGITVVVSAGNAGSTCGTITMPGDDPFVITVGGADDNGTTTIADDTIAPWSSCGPTTYDRLAKPDLVAPGRRMVSLRSPGSALDVLLPTRQITAAGATSPAYFTLSGTSMAAPVVTGAVALLLERDPTLTPRQVKQRLLATATPLSSATRDQAGAGLLNVLAAVGSTDRTSWTTKRAVSDGFARMVYPLINGQPLIWRDQSYNGGVDSHGTPWRFVTWSGINWDSITWEDITWEDITWEDITWESVAAQDITWETVFEPLSSNGPGWGPLE